MGSWTDIESPVLIYLRQNAFRILIKSLRGLSDPRMSENLKRLVISPKSFLDFPVTILKPILGGFKVPQTQTLNLRMFSRRLGKTWEPFSPSHLPACGSGAWAHSVPMVNRNHSKVTSKWFLQQHGLPCLWFRSYCICCIRVGPIHTAVFLNKYNLKMYICTN